MPSGYDLKCNDCGHGESVVAYYLSVVIDGKDEPLAHPGEEDDL
jgi:hypothetical protein